MKSLAVEKIHFDRKLPRIARRSVSHKDIWVTEKELRNSRHTTKATKKGKV
jgi:hypothetical protein